MGVADKMWEGISRVIRMDAKVEGLAATVRDQQIRIENLTGRVIRLETALEIALAAQGIKAPRIEKQYGLPSRPIPWVVCSGYWMQSQPWFPVSPVGDRDRAQLPGQAGSTPQSWQQSKPQTLHRLLR